MKIILVRYADGKTVGFEARDFGKAMKAGATLDYLADRHGEIEYIGDDDRSSRAWAEGHTAVLDMLSEISDKKKKGAATPVGLPVTDTDGRLVSLQTTYGFRGNIDTSPHT